MEDDPFLIAKMKQEKEGIFLWGLEDLHRLMDNKFRFTIRERAAANLKEARASGNNIIGFLKSENTRSFRSWCASFTGRAERARIFEARHAAGLGNQLAVEQVRQAPLHPAPGRV